ncbi:MAG: cyclic nucleotide-binding domain-containing protein [Kofleriaceae bacterium]|jgi:CRP/FNR family cyclic AMP-dependent transcriptional regulator|nr:cyclic nucleotide-binding domain-containing protein [Kofleriaceae bacterium]MBP9207173.1 cyclic nucleotide-binding domain-containing protein [Kofleriaceae bacterium]
MPPRSDDLRTIPLFRGFSTDELTALGALFRQVPTDSGAALFTTGQEANELYVLTAGEVVLDRPDDDLFRIRPPALIGELGALTSVPRTSTATPSVGAELWALPATALQRFLGEEQELGLRFLVNLLGLTAEKVLRDQQHMADMRQNLIRTQRELKRVRELVLETVETPLSAPIHDSLDRLITTNRRVNYRVTPPATMPASLHLDEGPTRVLELSRTHLSITWPGTPPDLGTWRTAVLDLAGRELPVSGKVFRVRGPRVTLELDLLIDEYAAVLEGYLTRVQLLDILV